MPVQKGQRFGGRQKGTKNRATILKEQERATIVANAAAEGQTPLEYMLSVMRTSNDPKRKDAMAQAAAPYVHPRLAAIEHSGEMTVNAHEARLKSLVQPLSNGHDAAH